MTDTTLQTNDIFTEENEVKNVFIAWNKVGDFVKGTLTGVREENSRLPGQEGKRVKIYDLLASEGKFTKTDGTEVTLHEGDSVSVGGKESIDKQMRVIKIGQIVGLKLKDIIPSKTKGFASFKQVVVYQGPMNPEHDLVSVEEEFKLPPV